MAAPINTAMDSLSAALKSNIIPNQEYLLQGSVLDTSVEVLLHRLRGLCDNVDHGPEPFHDHEMCFSIRRSNNYLPIPLFDINVMRNIIKIDLRFKLNQI